VRFKIHKLLCLTLLAIGLVGCATTQEKTATQTDAAPAPITEGTTSGEATATAEPSKAAPTKCDKSNCDSCGKVEGGEAPCNDGCEKGVADGKASGCSGCEPEKKVEEPDDCGACTKS